MTATVLDILGGPKILGKKAGTGPGLLEVIRTGLPYQALENAVTIIGLGPKEITQVLSIPQRTLARRKRERKLLSTESDRLFRVARIMAHAVDVFEDEDAARRWLHKPCRALGGVVPLSLLDTDAGAVQVDDELIRIEYGVIG